MRDKFILLWSAIIGAMTLLLAGCKQSDSDVPMVDYGYVQFQLVKSISEDMAPSSRASMLEWLADARKAEITMQSDKGATIVQTLPINYYDRESAEWGVTTEKLRLLTGTYRVIGCTLYDNLDELLCDGSISNHEFEVVKDGLTKDVIVIENSIKHGKIAFNLVKEFPTRADYTGDYLFKSIKAVDITVQHKINGVINGVRTTFEARTLTLHSSFDKSDEQTIQTAYIECAEEFWLEAGDYAIVGYTTYSDTKAKYELESVDIKELNFGFSVTHNQLNVVAKVPILLSDTAEHIKDYIALKEIWEAMDGENWSFHGEEYPAGANWNFNKDIDMWGDQPGVTLNAEGRVENLNLSGFGAKGVVPDAIGQLTDLKMLYLGNHNELIGGYNAYKSGRIDAMDYHNRVLKHDAREGLSTELKSVINRDATQRPILSSRINLKDVAFGNLTNGITGISRAMMRLTKLEQFFIANSPITTDGFFVGEKEEGYSWADFTNLTDVEIYNCPNLTALPKELIAELPAIQSLNVAVNYNITGEQLKADWETLINGASGGVIQILYLGFNNLEETPSAEDMAKMTKLGLLDCNSNKLRVVHPFGKGVNPTTIYLDYNNIENLYAVEDSYFCGVSQLETFSCSNNKLTVLPDLFTAKSVHTMISADFSSNYISELEHGNAWRGINAETLNLSNNRFESLPKAVIGSGSRINTLMLSANGMRKIEAGALKGSGSENLTTIDLSFNRLTELPYEDFSISNVPYLYGIDLSSNAFSQFPYAPLSVDRLTVISIRQQRDDDGNRTLREWPTGIGTHKSMTALYIGSNDLRKIEDTISPYILLFEIKDNPNISIDLSNVCPYIEMGYYELIYDSTQDIRGCDVLNLD
ncbi:MAG: DUF4458 domain-containing protein [Alistipes sp.]|nr:DUF4458 domain-containing protein [Alistipes sp.]